jgi:23S rRNA pseudouridine2605 synthase
MPRVLTVGRLDINTEGLLLLTNDGGLARVLELPSTGWLRRYRVRAHGRVEQSALDALRAGVTIEGMIYGAIEAEVERVQGTNVWLLVGLREGKNREVKRVMEHLGLSVNRLIRVSYGPFQLGDLNDGEVREVRGRVLRDQLGERLAAASGADFEAPIRVPEQKESGPARTGKQPRSSGGRGFNEPAPTGRRSAKPITGEKQADKTGHKPPRRSDARPAAPDDARRPHADAPGAGKSKGRGGRARGPRSADRRRSP